MTNDPQVFVRIDQVLHTQIDHVTIGARETLTLYFQQGDEPNSKLIQFEARVTEGGAIELFCNTPLTVRPFSEWESLETDRSLRRVLDGSRQAAFCFEEE